jgi:hypothetical protein
MITYDIQLGQATQAQARPNGNAQTNRRPPPQARDLAIAMRAVVAAAEEVSSNHDQLRGLQERQRVQPFPEQQGEDIALAIAHS